ncbi:hypothetical protein OG978_30675 [Streptomyces sp. NBC_01591]|uniref:hypothetical protein n=1 Tax=Streptomyces sp. NBC_01591 TaxID=2975888 RepID=UPI002DD8F5FB|nr:hypothetical protein [Streptomyces sp. NBC_01591]WSD71363.1 hypothetical protein OG978_30675 [Streptomyces sp. NBC_01591]
MVQKPESDIEPKERRIDLSLPQVAGSAVAAVAAAVAASQLGVYGTILGAGVMSVVATCGGSVFQHFFRRTGEQIREVTVQVKHPGREVTVHTRETSGARAAKGTQRPSAGTPSRAPDGAADATTMMPAMDATTVLRRADATAAPGATADDPDRTRMLRPLDATQLLTTGRPDPDEDFSEATTHGTRIRGWKRSALGAAVVFALTMAGITTYELISGNDLSGGQGTTVGSVVRGGERSSGSDDPAPSTSTDPGQGRTPDQESGTAPGTDQQGGRSQSPDSGQGDRSSADPTPSPTQSGSTGDRTSPPPAATPSPAAPGDGASAGTAPAGGGEAPAQGDGATTGTDTGQ